MKYSWIMKMNRRNFIKTGLATAGSLWLPRGAKAQDNTLINPFERPNTNSINYYGSGITREPLHKPVKITEEDFEEMKKGYQEGNSDLYQYWDVNGDGKVDIEDVVMVGNSLEKGISLPSDWDNLTNKEDRISWVDKMLALDKTDEKEWIEGEWISGDFSTQLNLNFFGFKKFEESYDDISPKYDLKNLGLYNLPVYRVGVSASNFGHGMNAILVGNINNGDPTIWNNWCFIEPQNKSIFVQPDSYSIPKNSNIIIDQPYRFYGIDGVGKSIKLVTFNIQNGIPHLIEDSVNPNLLLSRPSIEPSYVAENKPTQISLGKNYPNPFNSETSIEYSLKESGNVTLEVFNIHGQHLDTLVSGPQSAGKHSVQWKAENYSSGTYLYTLRSGKEKVNGKMSLIR